MNQNSNEQLPPTAKWLLAFQGFNAFNFTLAIGAPLVLTARFIGASEAEIGFILALTPMMIGLQLLGTAIVGWLGYRKTMIVGWGLRSFCLFFVVPLPFLVGRSDTGTLVMLMMIGMVGFNVIRGFASAAWFPWLTVLLPEEKRGSYLGKEQRVMNAVAFFVLIACGWFFGRDPEAWRYSVVFVVAWLVGLGSAAMLWQVPETGAGARTSGQKAMRLSEVTHTLKRVWRYRPFRRTILFVAAYMLALTAQPIFLVLYLREELGFGEGTILNFQAAATLGVLVTAVFWGKLSDRIGSRPLLRICDLGILSTVAFWLSCALSGTIPPAWSVYFVYFIGGVFGAAHAVAQSRLLLGCCPQEVVTLGIALFQFIAALCGGVAPVLFGVLLESLRGEFGQASGAQSVPFAVLFSLFLVLGLVSQFLLSHVPDPRRVPTRKVLLQVLYGWPMRVLGGLWSGDNSGRGGP